MRREINRLKLTNPELAAQREKFLFERNEIDEILTDEPDMSEVKFYPGSDKGPNPEDNPEHYSEWFVSN